MEEFVAAWEKTLGVKADKMSLADAWAKNPPHEAGKQSLSDFLGNVSYQGWSWSDASDLMKKKATYESFCYDYYHNYDKFRSAFKAKFGNEPYAEPNVAEQWYAAHASQMNGEFY